MAKRRQEIVPLEGTEEYEDYMVAQAALERTKKDQAKDMERYEDDMERAEFLRKQTEEAEARKAREKAAEERRVAEAKKQEREKYMNTPLTEAEEAELKALEEMAMSGQSPIKGAMKKLADFRVRSKLKKKDKDKDKDKEGE